jgi:hypothetical protein
MFESDDEVERLKALLDWGEGGVWAYAFHPENFPE